MQVRLICRSDFERNIEFEAYLIMDISMAEAWLKQGMIPVQSKLHFLYGVDDTDSRYGLYQFFM